MITIKKKKRVPFSGVYSKDEALNYFKIPEGMIKHLSKVMSGYGKPMWLDVGSGELVLAEEQESPKCKLEQLRNSGKK